MGPKPLAQNFGAAKYFHACLLSKEILL